MKHKRAKPRRSVHPVQPAQRLQDGSVKRAEYRFTQYGSELTNFGPPPAPVDLRKLAEGRPCMVRLPGCDGGGATTVLAHLRLLPYSGGAAKPSDLAFGAWACYHCHSLVDFRDKSSIPVYQLRLAHAEGVMRTIAEIEKLGLISGIAAI